MGVLLQAFYRQGDKGVPCPADGDPGAEWWWDHLARQGHVLREAGFTAVWLPPVWKGDSGIHSVGYDPFDDYDLGSRDQKGTVPTRYGTREQLARCVAMLRANGLDVYVDLVEHHRNGGSGHEGKTFRYVDADGRPGGGRFSKNPSSFHGGDIPRDPKVLQDLSFGSVLAPINGKPHVYVFGGLLDSADWMTRALDVQGFRVDFVKGMSTDFVFPLLNHGTLKGKFVVGEFFDGDLGLVHDWVVNPTGMRGRASAFDFPLRGLLFEMCNNAGSFDMARLDHAGLAGIDPRHAVTFVENHDTDSEHGPIVRNKPQAYAYILTSEGYPCVYYKDYSTDPGCYRLKKVIDNLIWIHEKLADGPTQRRWKDHDVFAYERLGGPHLLVGLNNKGAAPRTITVDTGFGPNAILHDYTGHGGDVRTDDRGRVTITIPRNDGGLGYVCYSRAGIGGDFAIQGHSVTQDYEGAQDLDIKPADSTQFVQVCRLCVAQGKAIRASLRYDTSSWTDATSMVLELTDPTGTGIGSRIYTLKEQGEALDATAATTGWYTFRIRSVNPPAANPKPSYKLTVTYQAPQKTVVSWNSVESEGPMGPTLESTHNRAPGGRVLHLVGR
jgi:alpha-amylase